MKNFTSQSWAEINIDALEYNYNKIISIIPEKTKIMAVLKADAYGCGAVDCMRALEKYTNDWYAVANIDEAIVLRNNGTIKPILILGYTNPEYVKMLSELFITQTVVSIEHGKELAEASKKSGANIDVHVKLDTGMNRIGLVCYDEYLRNALECAIWILSCKYLNVTGFFTHITTLYELDEKSRQFANLQYSRFLKFTDLLKNMGYNLGLCHCCNSAGIINMTEIAKLDMVRPGTMLFGIMPEKCKLNYEDFHEVISIKTTVVNVKTVKKGGYFSYSMSAQAENDVEVATLAIGYGDGYRRGLSNKGWVLINGQRCPVLGRICMDMIIVDISKAGKVFEGDEAVVLGKMGNEEIKAEHIGKILETGPSEVYCLLTKRLTRVYLKNSKPLYYVGFERKEFQI